MTDNRDKLELIAQALIERETLTAKELEELVETGKITDPPENDEDDDHNDHTGTPLVTPIPVADTGAAPVPMKETESAPEPTGETVPKLNVTHYDK